MYTQEPHVHQGTACHVDHSFHKFGSPEMAVRRVNHLIALWRLGHLKKLHRPDQSEFSWLVNLGFRYVYGVLGPSNTGSLGLLNPALQYIEDLVVSFPWLVVKEDFLIHQTFNQFISPMYTYIGPLSL